MTAMNPLRRSARAVSARRGLAWLSVAAVVWGLTACSSTPKDEFADTPVDELYAEAKDNMLNGGYERAIKALERIEGRAAGTFLAQQAQLDLAYVYWKSGERAQALATLERFIRLHPSSPGFDYALYLRGLVQFNDDLGFFSGIAKQSPAERDQQASRDAFQAFKQLVDLFPASRYTPDAKLRMDYIVNTLAAHEVGVARYYFRRGAYVAAVNRAQHAVTEFAQTPSIEEALHIMMLSYERLGLADLRSDAERVLRLNYPDSRFLSSDSASGRERTWWRLW